MIRIISDTTSSIPVPVAQEHGIAYLPQIIMFGEETYRDDTEIDSATFLKKLRSSSVLPKTAAPYPSLYTPIFKEYAELGDTMIVITPSSAMSGTFRSAEVAAQDFPNADIRIIDTKTVAGGLGSLVFQAEQWVKEGMDADSLVQCIQAMASREKVYFLVDTLEYLHKGGRIGGAQALFGSILQVKPILTINDGRVESAETQRTKRRALARIKDLVLEKCPKGKKGYLTICHSEGEEDVRFLCEAVASELGIAVEDIPIYDIPPAIIVHAGPGVLEISFFTE